MTGEQEALDLGPLDIDEFAEFWQVYPRHKDRRRAEGAYRRARKVATAEEILAAARAYAASVEGQPVERTRWAVEWLRAEPWRPEAAPVTPRPAPRARRRSKNPERRLKTTTRVREPETSKQRWLRRHGVTEAEYEQNKGDQEWLDRIKRRGIVA